jgi:hypothetical protein
MNEKLEQRPTEGMNEDALLAQMEGTENPYCEYSGLSGRPVVSKGFCQSCSVPRELVEQCNIYTNNQKENQRGDN